MIIKISVRGLVEFILRHGDIDSRRTVPAQDSMLAGSRIHRLIQSRMGTEYRAEFPLKYEYDTPYSHIVIDGRADGVITNGDLVTIDEIKGTYRHLDRIDEPEILHLAQARMYAAIYLLNENLEKICVRITYVNIETEEIKYFQSSYLRNEILNIFESMLEEYGAWADLKSRWYELRQNSIQNLEFPYHYREGQRELVGHVYRTIYHGRKLFIEAPTGTGKTLSVLFPAVRSLGEGRGNTIFYLTARNVAGSVARDSMRILCEHGLKARTLTLTSKEKICFMDEPDCNPDSCPYAKGHFDRINKCLYNLVSEGDSYDRQLIEDYARRYQVCPFELALDASLFADCIIADYNYVFDPSAYLKRFFGEGRSGDYLFLVDEAHNLVDRGRDMYSAVLVKEHLLKTKRECKNFHPKISAMIDRCNRDLLELKREGAGRMHIESEASISALTGHLDRLSMNISEYLAEHTDGVAHSEILELYFEINNFLSIYDLMEDNYIIYTDQTHEGDFFIKLFNVDPAKNLADCMERARSSILFSATFLPIQYYKSLLGGSAQDYEVYAQSLFDTKKRLLTAAVDVNTRYLGRNESQYVRMAEYIHRVVSCKKGNYLVFAPSYRYMDEVLRVYRERFRDGGDEEREELISQPETPDETRREEFLARFREYRSEEDGMFPMINADIDIEDRSLVGFCVLGGIFSEGIDLKNDALIGVIVMGTGLPQIGGERDILKNFFDGHGRNGFDYAYRFPGMNRVLQAAGRLIRTEDDRGVIVLLDDRFREHDNKRLLPREWDDMIYTDLDGIEEKVKGFWAANGQTE